MNYLIGENFVEKNFPSENFSSKIIFVCSSEFRHFSGKKNFTFVLEVCNKNSKSSNI